MIGNNLVRFAGSKRNLFAALASTVVFTAGCANMTSTAPSLSPDSSAATIAGRIRGGNQPVGNAAVTLYYAGQNGLGSGDPSGGAGLGNAIVAATTTSANDGTGSFSFQKSGTNGQAANGNTFSCPTSGDPIVYVVARGGNTLNDGSNSNNTAAAFIGIYGLCSQIGASSFVNLTEVTTVATMASIQQYFNPVTESIGADGIGVAKQALINTSNTIANMANLATGAAVTSTQLTGVGSVSVTATPETAKLNTLANIVSSCVNNASASASACTTLFTNATPPNTAVTSRPYHTPAFTQATDVLQALYYIFTNPTNGSSTNLQNIFNLAPAVGAPYQPTLASAPTDWNLAINFSSTNTCGGSGNFINSPGDINVDGSGNLWIANGQSNGNLAEISSGGSPLTCVQSGGSNGGGVIDNAGNIWYTSKSSNNVYRYKPTDQSVLTYTTAAPAIAIFADGGTSSSSTPSNIYFTTATNTSLYEIPAGATATSAVTPTQISTVVGSNPTRIIVDTSHNIWVATGGNVIAQVVPLATDPGNSLGYLNGFATYEYGVPNNSYGITVTQNPTNVYVSSNGSNDSFSALSGSGTNYSLAWTTTPGQAGINNPTAIVVDGRANAWGVNNASNTSTSLYSVSEVTTAGASLSPDGTTSGGFQLPSSFLNGGNSLTVDMSGNVWVAGSGNSVNEIVGSGVPVYQPYSVGLQNGRFQTIP